MLGRYGSRRSVMLHAVCVRGRKNYRLQDIQIGEFENRWIGELIEFTNSPIHQFTDCSLT